MTVEEIARFFGGHFGPLLDGETINLRFIPKDGGGVTQHFYQQPLAAAAAALGSSKRDNVYFGVNPRRNRDGSKEGVTRIVTLHADVDTGAGKPFATKADAYEALLALPIAPTTIVDSGGGLHAYFKVPPIEATAENIERAERAMRNLIYNALGGVDRVHDISRVLRVPGTINHRAGAEVRVIYAHA